MMEVINLAVAMIVLYTYLGHKTRTSYQKEKESK